MMPTPASHAVPSVRAGDDGPEDRQCLVGPLEHQGRPGRGAERVDRQAEAAGAAPVLEHVHGRDAAVAARLVVPLLALGRAELAPHDLFERRRLEVQRHRVEPGRADRKPLLARLGFELTERLGRDVGRRQEQRRRADEAHEGLLHLNVELRGSRLNV
jgi:hypothetical protein